MDLGPALLKSFRNERHAPQAVVCADPFHLVKLVSEAFDDVRRELWQQLRGISDPQYAKSFKEARGALLKKPGTLSEEPGNPARGTARAKGALCGGPTR